jgi:hypothetical protein
VKDEKSYTIDSLIFASVNEEGKSSFNFSSSIISAKFDGTFVPGDLGKVISRRINRYFDIGDTTKASLTPQDFTFAISVKNHPLLHEVILPGLEEFEPVTVSGSLASTESSLKLDVNIPRIKYTGFQIDNLLFHVESDAEKIDYALTMNEASNNTIKLVRTTLNGSIQNDEALVNLVIQDSTSVEKLKLNARLISLREGDYRFTILPGGLNFNGESWSVPEDNFVRFGTYGLLFNHFDLSNDKQSLAIHTPAQTVGEEINFEFKNFELSTFSQLIEKDSSLVAGTLTGKLQTRNTSSGSAFLADLSIRSLHYHGIGVGDIELKAKNNSADNFTGDLKLTGNGNDVRVTTLYKTGEPSYISADVQIDTLTMKSLSAFIPEQMTNADGSISGKIALEGQLPDIKYNGSLRFSDASFHSVFANNYFTIKKDKITFDNKGVYFSGFTVIDSTGNNAVLNGTVFMQDLALKRFDLGLTLENFTVLNTTDKDNELFYGKLKLNSNTKVTGNISLPKIYSKTRLLEGSNFTFAIPESKMSTNRGEGVVAFTDPQNKINNILTREKGEEETTAELKGIDLLADVEVNRNSTLKILIDPVSGDSLVLKGDATLSFGMDASGKTSLTGTYTVSEGSYRVSLQDIIRKDFAIKNGSTINWNGDPLEADINIDAVYEKKTSAADLVAGQIGGLSEKEKNTYKQALPFQVILHMKGALLKPQISFEIDLPPRYRGAMGGTVYAKLTQLNNDPSELNKQVFALLVLGRFIQEDPLASSGGSGGIASVARTSVSKILSQQLNKFSDQYIRGVEVNFDLQSYDDYSSGTAEAKTQLAIGIKKQLFNDRVSVEVGSMVDLSNNSSQRNTNELASDVTVEYKLDENGTYRLKAFRQNQYEDVIEGPLNVTGLGIIYTRDFDLWKNLFNGVDESEDTQVPLRND